MKIEDIFKDAEDGKLTLEQFKANAEKGGGKFVDLSEGEYVSKQKYEAEINDKNSEIETLKKSVDDRDKDLAKVQKQLTDAGGDAEKLKELDDSLKNLQKKYDDDTKAYEKKLSEQRREFAIKEHANTKDFTSGAAKRDYIARMLESEDVKLTKKGELIGTDEFYKDYSAENEDAFKKAESDLAPAQEPQKQTPAQPMPQFATPAPGTVPPKQPTLTELMMAKNENPNLEVNF